jgi:hypothetical protein
MTKLRTIFLSAAASCGLLLATSAIAQTANTPSPLTTPGSMNNTTPINRATGTPYTPQVNMTNGPITPATTSINPSTGQPYQPQVNMNGPATNNPGVVGNSISAQPPITTPAPAPQPNTPSATTAAPEAPPQ